MSETQLSVHGMTCASCVGHVEKALLKLPDVSRVEVNLATEKAYVHHAQNLEINQMIQVVEAAGYEAQPGKPKDTSSENQQLFRSFLFAAVFSLPLMAPMLLMPFSVHVALPPWLQLALATPVQFYWGARFYRGALKSIRARTGNMDLLVALGTSAAYFLSVYLLFKGLSGHHLYFESAAVIITLVLLGKWLEARAKNQSAQNVDETSHKPIPLR